MKLGVIGYPIKHSKSPIIHGHWLEKYDIVGTYEAIEIPSDSFREQIKTLINQEMAGFNVTIPYKTDIMNFCDSIDETAKVIGAVNTVHVKNKKIIGYNTDAYGFIQNIKENALNFYFYNKTALVLGAGGAAKAVIYGLLQEGVQKIILSNRTKEKADALKILDQQKIEVVEWDKYQDTFGIIDILVNTTSLGMVGQPSLSPDLLLLPEDALVSDIVYNPLQTQLLQSAEKMGIQTITGIGMLLYQAQKAFEIWTGICPDVDEELQGKLCVPS